MEYWKEFEKGYEVSNLGNVRSVDRIVYTSKQPLKLKGKMLKPAIDKKGYKRVAIMVDGKLTTLKVHRIVAKAFIENVHNKTQVNHIEKEGVDWSENQSFETVGNIKRVSYSYSKI